MATLDDVATNQDMVNIANAIRKVTRSTGKMTVLQMPERLTQIRVAEKKEVTVNLNNNDRIVLSTYDTSIKHLFLVTPKTTDDANLFTKTAPELELQFDQETGELVMLYTPHEDAVDISMVLVDILLPDDETSIGFLVNVSSQDFVDLSSEQVITGRKIFNAEADFNSIVQHNADVHVNDVVIQLTHTQKDQVTKIGADEIAIENGSGEQQVNYSVAFPKKSGTMLVDKDLDNVAKKDSNNNFSTSQTVNGTLTVNGNIVQSGSSYETHAEQVFTKNDEIITREGAVGGLSAGQLTGIKATKYDGENDGQLGFDANGVARVGDVNDTQPLLTRAESTDLTDGQLLKWDATNQRAVGSDSAEPLAEQIKNNEVQIANGNNLLLGGAKSDATGIAIGKSTSNTAWNGISIGHEVTTRGQALAIGAGYSTATANDAIALGTGAHATAPVAVQIGSGGNSTPYSLQIRGDNIYKSNTHTLTVENIEQDGNPVLGVLSGETDPTTETVGKLFQVYVNTSTGTVWQCTKIADGVYTWAPVYDNRLLIKGVGATSSNCDYAIVIGAKAYANHGGDTDNAPVVIGYEAGAGNQTNAIAIGRHARSSANGYAIGANSSATNFGSISIGPSSESYYGVSIGLSTESSYGISIGSGAKAGTDPDKGYMASCIQFLSGTNTHSNTLQIKDDNIYNYATHTLTVNNAQIDDIKLKHSDIKNVDTATTQEDAWVTEDADTALSMYHQNGTTQAGVTASKDYVEIGTVDTSQALATTSKVSVAGSTVTLRTEDTAGNDKELLITPEAITFSDRPVVKVNSDEAIDIALKSDLAGYVPVQSETTDGYYAQVSNENGLFQVTISQNGQDPVHSISVSKDAVLVDGKQLAKAVQPLYKHEIVIPYTFSNLTTPDGTTTVNGSVIYHYLSNDEEMITSLSSIDDSFVCSGTTAANDGLVLLYDVRVIKAGTSVTAKAINASAMTEVTGTVDTPTDTVTQLI